MFLADEIGICAVGELAERVTDEISIFPGNGFSVIFEYYTGMFGINLVLCFC